MLDDAVDRLVRSVRVQQRSLYGASRKPANISCPNGCGGLYYSRGTLRMHLRGQVCERRKLRRRLIDSGWMPVRGFARYVLYNAGVRTVPVLAASPAGVSSKHWGPDWAIILACSLAARDTSLERRVLKVMEVRAWPPERRRALVTVAYLAGYRAVCRMVGWPHAQADWDPLHWLSELPDG